MTKGELEEALKNAYKLGYGDKGVRDYDFHQHSHKLLDDFESKTCESCKHLYQTDFDKQYNSYSCAVIRIRYLTKDFYCNKYEEK